VVCLQDLKQGRKAHAFAASEPERREMQTVLPIFILSSSCSFLACLAAGWACVLPRPRRGVATFARSCPKPFGRDHPCRIPLHRLKAAPTEPSADAYAFGGAQDPACPELVEGSLSRISRSTVLLPWKGIVRCAILSVSAPFPLLTSGSGCKGPFGSRGEHEARRTAKRPEERLEFIMKRQ